MKMKKFLAVCVFVAISSAAMAWEISTPFQGTLTVNANWMNDNIAAEAIPHVWYFNEVTPGLFSWELYTRYVLGEPTGDVITTQVPLSQRAS